MKKGQCLQMKTLLRVIGVIFFVRDSELFLFFRKVFMSLEPSNLSSPEKEKKGILNNIANTLKSGLKESGDFIKESTDTIKSGLKDSGGMFLEGGKFVVEGIVDGGRFVFDGITDSLKFLLEGIGKAGEMVVDQATGTVGYIKDGAFYVKGKAVDGSIFIKDGVLMVGGKVVGTLINTGKFIGDSEYRENVGKPWLREVIDSNKKLIAYQMVQNKKSLHILYRYSLGRELSPGELEIAKKQLINMAKIVPAFAIFLLPGGAVLLPMLAKMLPWELIPDLKPPAEVADGEAIKPADQIKIPEHLKNPENLDLPEGFNPVVE